MSEEFHPILENILKAKKEAIENKKDLLPYEEILKKIKNYNYKLEHRNFREAIKRKDRISIIGECKKATPIKGKLIENYNIEEIAKEYYEGGVNALSVLTEEKFFCGDLYHLLRVKQSTPLSVLRKDFIIDEYQIYESAYFLADALLLIAAILTEEELRKFYNISKELGLEVLFEVHSNEDLDKVLKLNPQIIGINNRDLKTFEVDITNTEKLINFIPKNIVIVSESGISSKEDLKYIENLGVDAVLIGTYFMTSKNIKDAVKSLKL